MRSKLIVSLFLVLAPLATAARAPAANCPSTTRFDVVGAAGVETSVVEMSSGRRSVVLVLVTGGGEPERWYSYDRTSGRLGVSFGGRLGPLRGPTVVRDLGVLRALGPRAPRSVRAIVRAYGRTHGARLPARSVAATSIVVVHLESEAERTETVSSTNDRILRRVGVPDM